jgi:hypothetical protein
MSEGGRKKAISMRVDPQLLAWYRKKRPRGYQTLMHAVLKAYVEEQTRREAWIAGRAQEFFRRFHAQCFWHYDPDLEIDADNIRLVIDGLRKFGGREGFLLAEELCR